MKILRLSDVDIDSLQKILGLYTDSRMILIQQGSLTIDHVNLVWSKGTITLTFREAPATDHSKEE